ncbi:hypothetical protein IGI04_002898 [Brassica rapa subsp. trilocularis]|uniref:Uncharacterized protein n=1 Tax=Brassica rapa subsp. trilocularis TaxID=1813537 RepID=A0ABQ7NXL0_BRACM|nr:hypothetical protein IGI04_002898 [Brassica rapa subsp. trilocularis]
MIRLTSSLAVVLGLLYVMFIHEILAILMNKEGGVGMMNLTFRKYQKTLSEESPEGPFSAVLVITDEEAETDDTFCFGMCKSTKIEMLPFPQDKIISVVHTDSSGNRDTSVKKVLFIRKFVYSEEIEKGLCCFLDILHVKKPKPLDPRNIYQTVKINHHGTPPLFLKKKGWELPTSRSLHPKGPREALGLNNDLRARLPEFGFSVSKIWSGSVIEGEWYCPFMSVKENCSRIYHCENNNLDETNDENNNEDD